MPEAKSNERVEKKGGRSRFGGLLRFLSETRAEFKKIVWPTPRQVFNNTVVVIIAILLVGVFIWGLDTLSSLCLSAILKNY